MPDIPQFTRVSDEPLLDLDAIRWPAKNPTIMFPSVVEAPPWISEPLDRLYMYYASHHGTGLGLATAPEPEGPWTVQEPIFMLDDAPMIAGHVSSPDVLIDEAARRVYLYYHGSNAAGKGQVMGCAVGYDGVHFEVENPDPLILPSDREGAWDSISTAYLRPFRLGRRILGLYMGNGGRESVPGVGHNCQGVLRARDYQRWERVRGEPLLEPDGVTDFGKIRHSGVHVQGETLDLYYSTRTSQAFDREVIRLARVDASLPPEQWRAERLGTVLEPGPDWEEPDLRDPFPFEWQGRLYLFYAGGEEAGIGLAVQ
ncbi:MAG: hypothetical protein ACOX9R_16655 [Armatimonadota bacterium]|jgi:hypothetical protein